MTAYLPSSPGKYNTFNAQFLLTEYPKYDQREVPSHPAIKSVSDTHPHVSPIRNTPDNFHRLCIYPVQNRQLQQKSPDAFQDAAE